MTAEAEARTLKLIGTALTLCVTVAVLFAVFNPFAGRPVGQIDVELDLPYVGQGVSVGTPVLMHGVEVGQVTAVSNMPGGTVRLDTELRSAPTADLTDTMVVDFRPANYFGVTGINLAAGQGGSPLRDGALINTVPKGNFTLQTLLARLGDITDGVVTPQLISVVHKATRYTDALNPLLETMVITADAITKVQTVSTERLLRNTTGVSVAFPGFVDAATSAGRDFIDDLVTINVSGAKALPGDGEVAVPGTPHTEEFWQTRSLPTLDLIATQLFGSIGKLLSSHTGDLLPAVGLVQTISDTVPGLVAPAGIGDTMVELRTRFEKLYAGSPEQRALQVHILLDNLPGVQAPINAFGGP
ncbi:MlaD family protein [Mycolicibacterium austroafricanum]|uniref:MlaD family protein n=1 Tax=Mycolicibacterium austroafricanum TaxID=39687 RepID=UPI001CA36EB5|nr:MlaD family protein [Mycolicibacterium austroafricanum]QZT58611.1 MlaD family protein [Mycolicibacterium austroafricanum]